MKQSIPSVALGMSPLAPHPRDFIEALDPFHLRQRGMNL